MKNIVLFFFLFLLLGSGTLKAQTKEELIAQVLKNKDDANSLRTIERIGGQDPDYHELNDLYKKMSRKVKRSREGKFFKQYLKALADASVGKTAKGLTQFDPEGNPVSLMDLKGKYVFLQFWASWCQKCKEELPQLKTLYDEYREDGFEILTVSFDQEYEEWVRAIKENEMPWIHISDLQGMNNAARQVYGIRTLPQNLLIDSEGKIVARNIYGEQLRTKLKGLLELSE
ncbi:MAG TPA: TlpA disulfide reductase family protein [Sphingobacterium sp.]|nr:TlpA disulfide reductase family protein [Sphingobacterium sp.]